MLPDSSSPTAGDTMDKVECADKKDISNNNLANSMKPEESETLDVFPQSPDTEDILSMKDFIKSMNNSNCSMLSPRTSRSLSPSLSLPTLSPHFRRRKLLNNKTLRNVEGILGASPPQKSLLRLAKDPIQPTRGSITDVHSEALVDEEDEEVDFFSLDTPSRPRSRTCPENQSWQRRVRLRSLRRPPTPPPGSTENLELEKTFSKLHVKDKLHIPDRELAEVPETGQIIGEMVLEED